MRRGEGIHEYGIFLEARLFYAAPDKPTQQPSGVHTQEEQNGVVLLAAALNRRHWSSGSDGEVRSDRPLRRTGRVTRRRRVARGAAWQMSHVVKLRTVGKLPALRAVLAWWMYNKRCRHLAITSNDVLARRERRRRLLHDQAMLLQPPVCVVEVPICRSDAAGSLQLVITTEPHPSRAWVLAPYAPPLRSGPGACPGIA
eukprot:CAMPEP_0117515882 /NCGR_PEP_ID=MMETSP0784-20121206/30807_1 /TAXON_ID=39447 /ORGANISM="" /LENGTH=198 /DNA_ID=CAMNT_0005311709 /DNA_START=238 /DNA_END=834 /DNA_ORIENTATION=+